MWRQNYLDANGWTEEAEAQWKREFQQEANKEYKQYEAEYAAYRCHQMT